QDDSFLYSPEASAAFRHAPRTGSSSNNMNELLVEEEPVGNQRCERPLDDAFGRLRLVTVSDRIEFHPIRSGSRPTDQLDECSNAPEIGRAVVRVQRHAFVVLDRRL